MTLPETRLRLPIFGRPSIPRVARDELRNRSFETLEQYAPDEVGGLRFATGFRGDAFRKLGWDINLIYASGLAQGLQRSETALLVGGHACFNVYGADPGLHPNPCSRA